MPQYKTFSNQQFLNLADHPAKGSLVEMDGELMYAILNYNSMPPFFMSIVSSSDLWMYLSSNGSLTAGRQNYHKTLFPYETDDKIHLSAEFTGPKTLIRLKEAGKYLLWEPFSERHEGIYDVRRNLYKNLAGNKVIFQEINSDLQLAFTYSWTSSDDLGWIRKSKIKNLGNNDRKLEVTDGLLNILPYGIQREAQSMMSTLMDAYKVCELLPNSPMALFQMSAIPVDRAEPKEALRTNTVWYAGIEPSKILLSTTQLPLLRKGQTPVTETRKYGQKMAFLLHSNLSVKPMSSTQWFMVADVGKDSSEVIALQNMINRQKNPEGYIEEQAQKSQQQLHRLVSLADGNQQTGDPINDRRHYSNVLCNIMRGGIFAQNDQVQIDDFVRHLQQSNKNVYTRYRSLFEGRQAQIPRDELLEIAAAAGDTDLLRLTTEYLPLSFSRRHGDPSRPWNFFDIVVKTADGKPSLNYQGNWRDIFQNWEALALAFPAFLPAMITRFLNASTADGYNPYRLTRQGFDWEVPEPDNPWAFIGYWGDHQIIYLLRLLQWQNRFFPKKMHQFFSGRHFVYAHVPYRIKRYAEILKNPHDTIIFDTQQHQHLLEQSETLGADGKLLHNPRIQRASFLEKILVTLLTKLSNFVPEAGIWLNTQRPEWNDANNALVGNGASMVTLYHLRSFVDFLAPVVSELPKKDFEIASEIHALTHSIINAFKHHQPTLNRDFTPEERRHMMDLLGNAAEQYREQAYKGFCSQIKVITKDELQGFFRLIMAFLDHTIARNRRPDGLYHAYNLLDITPNKAYIDHLYLMLEGQVSILQSGILKPGEALELIQRMFESDLWRKDQQSFMLYPFRQLPGFMEKNIIPEQQVQKSRLLTQLIKKGHTNIIKQDENGNYHFHADMQNVHALKEALSQLPYGIDAGLATREEKEKACKIYESVFNHKAFTGRSGNFYKYEGLGSIYWHMVSKLLLAVGEIITEAESLRHEALPLLKDCYYRIRKGIGAHKSPEDYGAFPTDPYSHTPSMMGAQQPGLTGQVKEDVISRFLELGIRIQNGKICIHTTMLREEDFMPNQQLQFSFCHTPFIYKRAKDKGIEVYRPSSDQPQKIAGYCMPEDISQEVFQRKETISRVVVYV